MRTYQTQVGYAGILDVSEICAWCATSELNAMILTLALSFVTWCCIPGWLLFLCFRGIFYSSTA
jgi:hypothetical protein